MRHASDFLNESEIIYSLLDNLTYAITIYTKNKNVTEESLFFLWCLWHHNFNYNANFKKAIRHIMHIVVLLLLILIKNYTPFEF